MSFWKVGQPIFLGILGFVEVFEEGISKSSVSGEWSDDWSLMLKKLLLQLLGTFDMKISMISGWRRQYF